MRKMEENAEITHPADPNCQPPVIRVTSTNIALVRKLRMSVIARAVTYTGVSFCKTGFRKQAMTTKMFPRKPARPITVHKVDSKTTRSKLRGGRSNDGIVLCFVFENLQTKSP